jgi:anti-anti-sigma factor
MASTCGARAPSAEGDAMGFARGLNAQTVSRYGVASIALSGLLDIATVPILEQHLAYYEGDGVVAIMLDLHGVTFIDTAGLDALLRAKNRAKPAGYRLILAGASQPVRRMFEVAGAASMLDDQEAAGALEGFLKSQTQKSR